MIRPESKGALVLRPALGCAAAAYSFLLGGPIGGIVVFVVLSKLGIPENQAGPWGFGVGAAVGVGITVYLMVVRGKQAKIVIDSHTVKVTGLGGDVSTMKRTDVGWIEMARGSMMELSLTEGFSGEGHIYICAKSDPRRIELSVDNYNMSHAVAMARRLRVPVLMSRLNDRRRWWWTGRVWQEVTADAPAAPILVEPVTPKAGEQVRHKLRPIQVVIVVLILGGMAALLLGPTVVAIVQVLGRPRG